jgi:hypothetical protein
MPPNIKNKTAAKSLDLKPLCIFDFLSQKFNLPQSGFFNRKADFFYIKKPINRD